MFGHHRSALLWSVLAPVLVLVTGGLLALAQGQTYLIFHVIIELASVAVAVAIFSIGWNTRKYTGQRFFLLLAIGALCVGIIDFLHTLTFKGMAIFPLRDVNIPTQLWVAARYLEALTFLLGAVLLSHPRPVRAWPTLGLFAAVTALVLLAIWPLGLFPDAMRSSGLTLFKIISEYLIAAIFAGTGFWLWRMREGLDGRVVRWLCIAITLKVLSEIAFTLYGMDVVSLFNALGHILKGYATIALYIALIRGTLEAPYRTLFRDLGEREANYRQLFTTMSEGFALHEIITDEANHPVDYRFLEINPAFIRMTGLDPRTAVGNTVRNILPGIDDVWITTYGKVALTGQPVTFDQYAAPLDRHYSVLAYSPRPRQFATIFYDITEAKRAQAERESLLDEIRRRAAELDATFLAMEDGVMIYDRDGNILRANPIAATIFGYTPKIMALPMDERLSLLRAEDLEGNPVPLREALITPVLNGEVVRGLMIGRPRDEGPTAWYSASAAPIRTDSGEISGVVATFTDVTALHALQEQQRIFLHMVSHDLRAPLTILAGHAALLPEIIAEGNAAMVERISDTLVRGVRRMNVMIEDLVDMGRIEGGQFKLNLKPLSLTDYLPSFLQRNATALNTHRIILELPESLPVLQADDNRLERVLMNLLGNAQNYSPTDSTIQVRAQCRQNEITVSITDEGSGIAPEDQPHLFNQFFRGVGDNRPKGMGLGLYITRLLVEAHGGRIAVESVFGEGSTFTVILPITPPEDETV